jgi:hypothetical protein
VGQVPRSLARPIKGLLELIKLVLGVSSTGLPFILLSLSGVGCFLFSPFYIYLSTTAY